MIRAILFDLGGTLDGDGLHWLDRFVALYQGAGVTLARARVREAFDAAEERLAVDEEISTAGLDAMVARHVDWQLAHLGLVDAGLRDHLIRGFVEPIRTVAARNRRLLEYLTGRALVLGVVSNGCGNVDVLCRDYGYTPFLSAIVDSRCVGISKPDPKIFTHAAALLGIEPARTLFVGDSFDRDILPARQSGMQTAWLQPDATVQAPDPRAVDIRLARLADLRLSLATGASVTVAGVTRTG